jgi:predicted exporter
MSDRAIRWSFAASVVALAAYALTHLELSTDITGFLPAESDAELAVLASRLSDSELTRTMILTLGAPEPKAAVAAAGALAARMREHPEVARVTTGVDPGQLEHFHRIYFPRRHYFWSEAPERDVGERFGEDALRRRAREVRASLALPTSTLTSHLAAGDPIGAFESVIARLGSQRPPLDTLDGSFVTPDRRFAVVFLTTHAGAFDSKPQAEVLDGLAAAFAAISAASDVPLTLETSGANRFAVAAETSIRRDVHAIVALSFVGIAVVFFAFFRSLHFFLLAVFPSLSGILFAAVVMRAVGGRLDGVTMAFGASLIGVAIDYSIHVLDHYRLEPLADGRAIVRRLRPSLVLGALTTMASFAGLALTSFPGFREIGAFATLGVAAALGVTLFVLPAFLPGAGDGDATREVPPLARAVATRLGAGLDRLARRRRVLALVPLACVLGAVLGLPALHFDDDLSRLMSLDPALRAEEERVRARVSREESGRVVFALGTEAEEAVATNDAVAARLATARDAGRIGDFRSLHALLWSRDLQERNLAALRGVPDLAERVEAAFSAEGFRPEALAPFREALAAEPPPPLDAATLRDSPLRDLVGPLLLDLGDRTAAVTYLRGESDPAVLGEVLADLEHVHVFDQKTFMNAIYREFRATTLQQIGVGCALVVIVLLARYRRWRPALAAFLPSLLVACVTLAGFAALGVPINLLHVTSLVLVMGMGVDYGIFIVDSAGDRAHLEATLLSLLLSCLTTVFVFGTLAVSEHAALRAIGATTGVGVLASFVLAPVTLVLLRPRAEPAHA